MGRMPNVSVRRILSGIPLAYFGLSVITPGLAAQQARPLTVSIVAGPSLYDFGGVDEDSRLTGLSFLVAAHADYRWTSGLVAEASLACFQYTTDFSAGGERWLLPEMGIRLAGAGRTLRPYVGVGAGLDVHLRRGTGATVHGVADPSSDIRPMEPPRRTSRPVGNTP